MAFKERVRKALDEIEQDKWHERIHDEIRRRAISSHKPKSKEQCVMAMCGVCNEVQTYRIPAMPTR